MNEANIMEEIDKIEDVSKKPVERKKLFSVSIGTLVIVISLTIAVITVGHVVKTNMTNDNVGTSQTTGYYQ